MPKYIGSSFTSQFRLNELKNFFKKYPDAGAGMQKYVFPVPDEEFWFAHKNFNPVNVS